MEKRTMVQSVLGRGPLHVLAALVLALTGVPGWLSLGPADATAAEPPLTLTSLTPDRSAPQTPGTRITFTATATGGTPPYQAKWWVSEDGGASYTVRREWGPNIPFAWTPTQPNLAYRVGVWLKSAGNPADAFEAGDAITYPIAGAVLTLMGLTATPDAPQPIRTSITFTAAATGGTPPYQVKWWLSTNGGASYTVARDWGPNNLFTWTPTTPNLNYMVGVWLRSAGNPAEAFEAGDAVPFPVTEPPPLTLTGIVPDRPSPRPVQTPIAFTAVASGGTPPYQAKWWVSDNRGTTYTVARDWGPNTPFTWTPTTPNLNYMVGVWLRSADNPRDLYEDGGAIPYGIRAASPAEGVPPLDPRLIGDPTRVGLGGVPGCTPEIHDLYVTTGPDGRRYRTWHALWHPRNMPRLPTFEELMAARNDPACYFAHEHGDPPLALARPATGAPLPAFGYAAMAEGRAQIEAHVGYKLFTHLQGQQTGWRTPEDSTVRPDWDLQFMVHQGTGGAGRLTLQFHEVAIWALVPGWGITDVRYMTDTGQPQDLCGPEFEDVFAGRTIVSGGDNHRCASSYETWWFGGQIGESLNIGLFGGVVNPMNHFHGQILPGGPGGLARILPEDPARPFVNSSEELCATDLFNPCPERLPFGHPHNPAGGWMGTQRFFILYSGGWTNGGGPEALCSDVYGQPLPDARCAAQDPGAIRQRVARVDFMLETDSLDRGPGGATWELAFPRLTRDPQRPRDCEHLECDTYMPQGAPLGN